MAEIEKHPGVKFNGTFVDDQGREICDWEAPSAQVVREIVKAVLGEEAPVDEIVEVKRVM